MSASFLVYPSIGRIRPRSNESDKYTFVIGNKRSLKELHRNCNGEETSARSYLAFIVKLLESNHGVLLKSQVYDAIFDHYGSSFGPDDQRYMMLGRGGAIPKWRNQVAWALVMGACSYGDRTPLFRVKNGTLPAGRKSAQLVVLLNPTITSLDYLNWALAEPKRKKRVFTKSCPNCRNRQALSRKVCDSCRTPFPAPTKKIDKFPR